MRGVLLQAAVRLAGCPPVLVLSTVKTMTDKILSALPRPPGPVSVHIKHCTFWNRALTINADLGGRTSKVSQIAVVGEDLKDGALDYEGMLLEAEAAGRRNRVRFGPCGECGKMAMYGFFEFRGPRHSREECLAHREECLARQVLES